MGQSVKKELKQPSDKKLLFGCKLCGFKSRQWKIIERHKRHHKQQHRGRFTCTKCDFACNRLALIASHKWTHRSVETLYVERRNQRSRHICRLCSLTTGSWVKLKLHKCTSLLHRSGLRNCGHCEFRGKREESVVIHCLTVHGLTVSSALRPANSPINISVSSIE